jgi:glyoxylase-like metal-dependent hydrolase (beta-lactamase superfamily II)
MRLENVSKRIYANCEGTTGGNVGIILTDNAAVAVDAQYPVSGLDFRASIPNYTEKPVTHLLLTHYHGDHVFGNQAFEDCQIVSHIYLKDKMEENLRTQWAPGNLEKMLEDVKHNRPERAYLFEGLKIVLPTHAFEDRYELDGITMFHLPGHTDGSAVVHVPSDRVLFAGDLMFAETFPWAGDPTANPDDWIEAFKELLKMDIETYIPGHGPLCGKGEFEKQLAWFKSVRAQIKDLIADGATEEDVVNYDAYPAFYADSGDRKPRSLRHWYKFYSSMK